MRTRVGRLAALIRSEAEHAAVRGRTRQLAPARPHVLERRHRPLASPRAGTLHDRFGQLVDGQFGVRQRVADGRDDLVGLVGVKRTGSGCIGTDEGSADSAPVHIGRSAVDSRCTVPRGPNVLTRVRSFQRACCTSARVAPAMRRPIDSSAALRTWACTPHRTRATSAGPRLVAGWVNAWRAIRRAVTPLQVSEAGVVDFRVTDAHSARLAESAQIPTGLPRRAVD
jgi:hypothetical protein